MAKRKRTKGQKKTIYKTLHRKLKIEQHEPLQKAGLNSGALSMFSSSMFMHACSLTMQYNHWIQNDNVQVKEMKYKPYKTKEMLLANYRPWLYTNHTGKLFSYSWLLWLIMCFCSTLLRFECSILILIIT